MNITSFDSVKTFYQSASGATGVETLLPLALELFHNDSIKLSKIIASMTCNPAKVLKINKGNLNIGNEADFCIVDLYKPRILKKENLQQSNSIFYKKYS